MACRLIFSQDISMDAPKRILIVDDEPNVRLVFRTALEATGYQVPKPPTAMPRSSRSARSRPI